MEIKYLQYFLSIVNEGSMAKAAEKLYISQPALSRFLARLEEELGTALFVRNANNSLSLTDAGKLYLETAEKMNALWHSMQNEIRRNSENGVPEVLRIGIADDGFYNFVKECKDRFQEQNPHIEVHIVSQHSSKMPADLLNRNLICAITSYAGNDKRLLFDNCGNTKVDLMVSPDSPLARHSFQIPGQEDYTLSLHDLPQHMSFVILEEQSILRTVILDYMKEMDYTPNIVTELYAHSAAPRIISQSPNLIGMYPRLFPSDSIRRIALDPPLYYPLGVLRTAGTLSVKAEELIRLCSQWPQDVIQY